MVYISLCWDIDIWQTAGVPMNRLRYTDNKSLDRIYTVINTDVLLKYLQQHSGLFFKSTTDDLEPQYTMTVYMHTSMFVKYYIGLLIAVPPDM